MFKKLLQIVLLTTLSTYVYAVTDNVSNACKMLSDKLQSVTYSSCINIDFSDKSYLSVKKRPILYKEYPPKKRKPRARVLFLGGIHGDELSAFSVSLKWMAILKKFHSGLFHWVFLPALNIDGLLAKKPTRFNANGVDLNRNFPPSDGEQAAFNYWVNTTNRDKRRYPGPYSVSEPETQVVMDLIESFKPDIIVSLHAPLGIIDFDGAYLKNPGKFGNLHLHLLGTYPGSLGNYGWKKIRVPVITIELPHAGSIPTSKEILRIWSDLIRWLKNTT